MKKNILNIALIIEENLLKSFDEEKLIVFLKCVQFQIVLLDNLGAEFIKQLLLILPLIEDDSNKALIIEVILKYEELEELLDRYEQKKLLDEYVFLVSKNVTDLESSANCFENFLCSDITCEELLNATIKFRNNKNFNAIFSKMGFITWKFEENESYELEVRRYQRIRMRSDIVTQFILLTNSNCAENIYLSINKMGYYSFQIALNDWGWHTKESLKFILTNKIVSEREGEIFRKVGELVINGEIDYDNYIVNKEKAKMLYDDFFEGKDIFEVIYHLPD